MLVSPRTGVLKRDDWLDLARKLDWDLSYVSEKDAFPEIQSGRPWLPHAEWAGWDEPFRTSYPEYVAGQHAKEASVAAVRESVGRVEDYQRLPQGWLEGLKLHAATLPLAEFAAVVGNLRAARFGRDSAWRSAALLGALDEMRHAQIPLLLMHDLVRWDPQFDWTHKFFHTNNWVAIAARHLADELLLASDAIEFAIATNFVFETGFTNVQFVGLSALAHGVGDKMFEKMVGSIQSDEARHAQIGAPVLATVVKHDRAYAQHLLDKWFWRSWLLFAVVTGFAMDYLTPLEHRTSSFKEFMHEWVLDQFLRSLDEFGLRAPVVLGHLPRGPRQLSPHGLRERVQLPRVGLVQLRRARAPGTRLAAREVSGLVARLRSDLAAHHRPLARLRSRQRLRRAWHRDRVVLRSLPAGAVERHAARQHRQRSGSWRAPLHLLFAPVPVDLRAGAGALRRSQGRRQTRARGGGAREPGGAGAALLRARLRHLGQGRVRRRLPLDGKVGKVGKVERRPA